MGKWNNSSRFFNGFIDDARIYNRALTGEEIRNIFERRKNTYYEPAISIASSTVQGIAKFFKGVTNTVLGDGYITYPLESSIDNVVNTNLSITPPTGNASTTITDGLISLDYASTTAEGLIINEIDRQIDIHISSSTSLRIAPSSSTLNVEIKSWNKSGNYYKKWVESSPTHSVTSDHTIGDLSPGKTYALKIDGVQSGTYTADSSGQITFTYSAGYSTKTFEVEEVTTSSTDSSSSSSTSVSTSGGRLPLGWNVIGFTEDKKIRITVNASQIKNPSTTKDSKTVRLTSNVNNNAKKIEVSASKDFASSTIVTYSNPIEIDLCKSTISKDGNICKDGEYTLYVRFINVYGLYSEIVPVKIKLGSTTNKKLFTRELYTGLISSEVSTLQKFLSELPEDIYPEKKVTGFYGPLTEKAVKKFQIRYNVVKDEKEKGYGVVGPKTRAKLNELI